VAHVLLALLLLGASTAAHLSAQPEPGSELRVWLLTAGPGEAVWERFGHNAIRVLNTETGRDVSYNWGIFDFNQVDFIPRFLKGQMLYMMAPFSSTAMIDSYARVGREIVSQELALTPAQKVLLSDFAERNALPQNREYFYDYFLDNCSTRVRDLLDYVLSGRLIDQFGDQETGTSYRYHIRRLTRVDPLLYTGMDILLGNPGDEPITVWGEMFVPMTLRDAVREVTIVGADGSERPLVLSEEVLSPSAGITEPTAAPRWFFAFLLLGLAGGGALGWAGTRVQSSAAVRHFVGVVGTAWALLAGVAGLILLLVLFTDHDFMRSNENLFLLNPLSLALTVLVPLAIWGSRARRAARITALVVLGFAVLGFVIQVLPSAAQQNGIHLALFLPMHAGLAFVLHRLDQNIPLS
jgi:hypothetical protein